VFFLLSEKQPVVLSNQPVVLLLGVFEKVENCFRLVELTAKPNNRLFLLNQVCSCFEESKSFVFDGRLDVLVVAEVL